MIYDRMGRLQRQDEMTATAPLFVTGLPLDIEKTGIHPVYGMDFCFFLLCQHWLEIAIILSSGVFQPFVFLT